MGDSAEKVSKGGIIIGYGGGEATSNRARECRLPVFRS